MTKENRLEQLIESYKLAVAIYYSLFSKELLNSNTVEHQLAVTLNIATTIRESKANNFTGIDTDLEPLNEQLSDLFFQELRLRGSEWNYADLEADFYKLKDS